jgi:hypothetical protein
MGDNPEHSGPAPSEPAKLTPHEVARTAVEFSQQAEKLSHQHVNVNADSSATAFAVADVAVEAQFVTPHDPVIVTSQGNRLPSVPLQEAHKLNVLREELQGPPETVEIKEGRETA